MEGMFGKSGAKALEDRNTHMETCNNLTAKSLINKFPGTWGN